VKAHSGLALLLMVVLLAWAGGLVMADETLLVFTGLDPAALHPHGVKLSLVNQDGRPALLFETGTSEPWPGIVLKPQQEDWDLYPFAYLDVELKNLDSNPVKIGVRVDNPGADGTNHCVQVITAFAPGEQRTLRVRLPHLPLDNEGKTVKFFGMRGFPEAPQQQPLIAFLKSLAGEPSPSSAAKADFNAAHVTQLLVFLPQPQAPHKFLLFGIEAKGRFETAPETKSFLPFIDKYGQYIQRDWPGKTHSDADLQAAIKREQADLAAHPGPEDWDQYGGWKAGPQLEAKGHFWATKYQGEWWLVDPEGHLFFSNGVDCVGPGCMTPIADRRDWYADLPPEGSPFAQFYRKAHSGHGYYKGRTVECYDFGEANLLRKYGEDWRKRFAEVSHRRLRSWGLNTIGNWSSKEIYKLDRTPYTANIHFSAKQLEGSHGYWRKFWDVFDPSFKQGVEKAVASEAQRTGEDPWCIGYFVDNELSWGDETYLASAALSSPLEAAAKRAFIADLRAKYGAISRLNAQWGTDYASWEALLASTKPPERGKAKVDLVAFTSKTARVYFGTIKEAIKRFAPQKLYLGCRFAWVNPVVAEAAAENCDVVSFNLYRRSVADFKPPFEQDAPLIIGEFHFGALDRGMFHTGLVPVLNQQARARAYLDYVHGVLAHPQFVGCHWFKYQDESTTGRPLDGENYQIGLIDVCDMPYAETRQALREVGYNLYEYRSKSK